MRAWLEACGRPDRAGYRIFIVAGSKGKGSTAAMIASVLTAAGLKAGLYTSPHLESWTERIRVDGRPIAPLVRPPLYVPEGQSAAVLMRQLQQERRHLAIVIDEHGGTAGIVTL